MIMQHSNKDNDFIYNAKYRVVICKSCRYAIQKSALESHLLRHKIYREERRRLLLAFAKFDLCEPDDVLTPALESSAIEHLGVISGFRCCVEGCGVLYAVLKRMNQHQSRDHAKVDSQGQNCMVSPAQLQTFFRGTKTRYFEVARSQTGVSNARRENSIEATSAARHQSVDGTNPGNPTGASPLINSIVKPSLVANVDASTAVPLDSLTYFHHFTTKTCLTLPACLPTQDALSYWQQEVVPMALRQQWLMWGILALSSWHLSVLREDTTDTGLHRHKSMAFRLDFFRGWESARSLQNCDDAKVASNLAGQTVYRVLHLLSLSLGHEVCNPEEYSDDKLQTILSALRSFVDWGSHSQPKQSQDVSGQKTSFDLAADIITADADTEEPSSPLNHFTLLPSRIAEFFDQPDDLSQVMTTLSAIASLVSSSATSFAATGPVVPFMAMASWLLTIPDSFRPMIEESDPVALVVVANWASVLVRRAEECGCWYLGSSSQVIVQLVKQRLDGCAPALQMLETYAFDREPS